jgi:hypothetical protein
MESVLRQQTSGNGSPVEEPKPNNIFVVPVDSMLSFFRWWCVMLRPFVPLTDREMDVMASFLKQRWDLSKTIFDAAMIDTVLMSEDIKKKVIKECGISLQHFYVVMSTLKKKKVINGNIINPKLIPNTRDTDNGVFQLRIMFKEDKPKHRDVA